MVWTLRIAKRVEKALKRLPAPNRARVALAIRKMAEDPFAGDVVRLQGTSAWRRRVGAYRIFFDIEFATHTIDILDLQRRTSTTY
jgi:mRNA-degrading endonuclease RelE of RelBE toxin-antitoxin system